MKNTNQQKTSKEQTTYLHSINHFNLIDEPWIPISDYGLVSLHQVFSEEKLQQLGGNPVQKMSVMKLLLAIAQAAMTPKDELEWTRLGTAELSRKCCEYLAHWHDRFYLYGDKPFLQMPSIIKADIKPFGAVLPEVSTGNTTVLTERNCSRQLSHSDQALLLISLMAFSLGGKKTDNSVVLTHGYTHKNNEKGKPATAKPGSAVGHMGFLHHLLVGDSLQETVKFNLMTVENLIEFNMFEGLVGVAPWEKMPEGEDCHTSQKLKKTLMGRLIPVGRFCLLTDNGLHYSEGVLHQNYKEGMHDLSLAINHSGKEPKANWVNPEKRPWRELVALLSFTQQLSNVGFESPQLKVGISRLRDYAGKFGVWSGGVSVSSNAGEQYVSGHNDYVESVVWLHTDLLKGGFFDLLRQEMKKLEQLEKQLYAAVCYYFKQQKVDPKKIAPQATQLFWQLCERDFQQLVDVCDSEHDTLTELYYLRRQFASYVQQAYQQYCPNNTARQLEAWAKCTPKLSQYLQKEARIA